MSQDAIALNRAGAHRISIAILALGGEGGGVLAQWIAALGQAAGYYTQATSVPGVAQRTGATIYYVELAVHSAGQPDPILCLMPVPGDVDIVLASELVEAGRAVLRGFVSRDRTTLISSTHRIYSIAEKSVRGDGTARSETIMDAAGKRAKRFLSFDMSIAAMDSSSAVNAVMFGALAGSGALAIPVAMFRDVVTSGDKASQSNLAGFNAGLAKLKPTVRLAHASTERPAPTTPEGRALVERIESQLPERAWTLATEGVRRLVDYQDAKYANLYLDRLVRVARVDSSRPHSELTSDAARHLALWMSYEDTIRVADLKIRSVRFVRIRHELRIHNQQILDVTEFMHPRLEEVCDTLPRSIGVWLLNSAWARRLTAPLFKNGRFVKTSNLAGFLMLSGLASLRRYRRSTKRFIDEQRRIDEWLQLIEHVAGQDVDLAVEIVRCQRVIKGYGDTLEKGLETFEHLMSAYRSVAGSPRAAQELRGLREKALAMA